MTEKLESEDIESIERGLEKKFRCSNKTMGIMLAGAIGGLTLLGLGNDRDTQHLGVVICIGSLSAAMGYMQRNYELRNKELEELYTLNQDEE